MRTRPDEGDYTPQRTVPVQDHPPRRHASPIPEEVYKPWKLPRQNAYVFVNINVVDTIAGKIQPGRIVRIQDGKIKSITLSSDDTDKSGQLLFDPGPNDDAIYINSAGKYLSPGLIDNHVHRPRHGRPAVRHGHPRTSLRPEAALPVQDDAGARLHVRP